MRFGLLSGKYDSTKQRAVLLNGDRLRNYRRYNATLRMEMLLTGGIVLTDAQFLDGLYFLWIAQQEDEYKYFKECADYKIIGKIIGSEEKLLDVKCRIENKYKKTLNMPKIESIPKMIFGKKFYNSSIEMKELAEYVFRLSSDYTETIKVKRGGTLKDSLIREFVGSFAEYAEITEKQLESLYGKYIAETWKNYTNNLKKLFNFDFGRWGFSYNNRWIDEYNIETILDQKMFIEDKTYREKLIGLLGKIKGKMKNIASAYKYFVRIKSEINKNLAVRSVITDSFDKIEYILHNTNFNKRKIDDVMSDIKEFKYIMNDRYNKAFAYQHGCKFVDMCDYPSLFDYLKDIPNKSYILNKKGKDGVVNIEKLWSMSWKSFKSVLDEISPYTKEWLRAYDRYSSGEIDEEGIQRVVEKFLSELDTSLSSIRIRSSDIFIDCPWNPDETKEDNIYKQILQGKHKYSFVGGGSFSDSEKEGNEICVLCSQLKDGKAKHFILRFRTDEDDVNDKNYDTMIAPVENIFNGGNVYV